MAQNNAINATRTSNAFLTYNGAGTFTNYTKVPVSLGGTDATSFTVYSPICGGTTSTSAFQSAITPYQGFVLTSNGAGALPTFQAPVGQFTFTYNWDSTSPVDGTTYYIINSSTLTTTFSGQIYTFLPRVCTLKKAYGAVTCTTGSSESVTIKVVLSGGTNINLTTSLALNASPATFNNTSINTLISGPDYFSVQFVSPTWTSNPTTVRGCITLEFG